MQPDFKFSAYWGSWVRSPGPGWWALLAVPGAGEEHWSAACTRAYSYCLWCRGEGSVSQGNVRYRLRQKGSEVFATSSKEPIFFLRFFMFFLFLYSFLFFPLPKTENTVLYMKMAKTSRKNRTRLGTLGKIRKIYRQHTRKQIIRKKNRKCKRRARERLPALFLPSCSQGFEDRLLFPFFLYFDPISWFFVSFHHPSALPLPSKLMSGTGPRKM